MKPYLRKIDTETEGNRNDVTPLFADAVAFGQLTEDLAAPFRGNEVDVVAGIDALGFILGTAMAKQLGVGFVPVRKGGKLPVETESREFTDYSGEKKRLEVRKDVLTRGAKVLVVDEWVETGAQVAAAVELVESQGAEVAGIATIQMDRCERTDELRRRYCVMTAGED